MRVHQPEITEVDGRIRLSSRIESRHPAINDLGHAWFEVEPEHRDFLSDRSDAFAVLMLPMAMTLAEEIEIDGVVSPRLALGLREFQSIQTAWSPAMHRVSVSYRDLREAGDARGTSVGANFSGGVDSFYTLLRHTADQEPVDAFRVRHVVMINGFDLDVDLEEAGHFEAIRTIYQPMFRQLGTELVVLRSNVRDYRLAAFRNLTAHSMLSYGTVLVAGIHALGRLFSRFFIAGGYSYEHPKPEGTNNLMCSLLSTDALHIVVDGGEATRFQKITYLSGRAETWSRLRICSNRDWTNIDPATAKVRNCARCDKCVRTMVSLDLSGALPRYSTFVRPLTPVAIHTSVKRWDSSHYFAHENIAAARERRRRDVSFHLAVGLGIRRMVRTSDHLRRYAVRIARLFGWKGRRGRVSP